MNVDLDPFDVAVGVEVLTLSLRGIPLSELTTKCPFREEDQKLIRKLPDIIEQLAPSPGAVTRRAPIPSCFVVADQFLVVGVHADDRVLLGLKPLDVGVAIAELRIAVRMLGACKGFEFPCRL